MKRTLLGLVVLIVVAGAGVSAWLFSGTVVRQLRPAGELLPNGIAETTRTADALDCSVAIDIAAPPAVVWALLTEAKAYPQWNSTVMSLDGTIRKTEVIRLVAKTTPGQVFELKVREFEPMTRMAWEGGGRAFMGVRTFTLTPNATAGTTFAMSETLSGRLLPMLESSLPDFRPELSGFAADLKRAAERVAPQ